MGSNWREYLENAMAVLIIYGLVMVLWFILP